MSLYAVSPANCTGGRFTHLFEALGITVLRATNVKRAGQILRISWDEAWHIMERAVLRGRAANLFGYARQLVTIDALQLIKLAILLRIDQSPHPCANNCRQRRGTGQQLRQRSTGSRYGEAPIYNAEHSAREESGEMCEHIGVFPSGTDERKQADGGGQWRPAVGPACSAC